VRGADKWTVGKHDLSDLAWRPWEGMVQATRLPLVLEGVVLIEPAMYQR
jgi:hypothetical protein